MKQDLGSPPTAERSTALSGAHEMRVLVCGSRSWTTDVQTIYDELRVLPSEAIIMHGGCDGADLMASGVAWELGLRREKYLPDPSVPSPQKFHQRNDRMLEKASCVIAFWDGESRGTASVITKARNRGLPYRIVPPTPTAGSASPSGAVATPKDVS